MRRFISFSVSACLLVCAFGCASTKKDEKAFTKVHEGVIDLGTYTSIDEDAVLSALCGKFDTWGKGGCTAAVRVTDGGKTIVGRNLDLYISNKPAYVFRTDVNGFYKTLNVSYSSFSGPDFEDLMKDPKALNPVYRAVIPFLSMDVLNEKGLYMEINMRNTEYNADGSSKFGCTGTNPGAGKRLFAGLIPFYVCRRCANVREAVELIRSLDVFTSPTEPLHWNFTFLLADAEGNHGVVEIARNKVSFLEGQDIQTNFYLTEEFGKIEELQCGLGRYDEVRKGLPGVRNEADMLNLMNGVTYFQAYFPDKCKFDPISEYVDGEKGWTNAYLNNPSNRSGVLEHMRESGKKIGKLSRKELQDLSAHWESATTVITNCTDKTMRIRFFEDDSRVVNLHF